MCARGGTGRRAGFRFQSERVQVQFLSGAPKPQKPDKHWLLGLFISQKIWQTHQMQVTFLVSIIQITTWLFVHNSQQILLQGYASANRFLRYKYAFG